MEVLSIKAPTGNNRREPAIEIAGQENALATILRHKPASVEYGRFCGENLEAWIFQAKWYFDFYRIEDDQRLTMASFYLDSEALEWYRWLFRNKKLVDWTHFAEKVQIRFKQKGFESVEGRLAKLRQVTTVSELQGRFEAIANETEDVSERLMVKHFISGLREDIKNSVLSHEPKTFEEALTQAHIYEHRIHAEKGPVRPVLTNKGTPLLPSPTTTPNHYPSTSYSV